MQREYRGGDSWEVSTERCHKRRADDASHTPSGDEQRLCAVKKRRKVDARHRWLNRYGTVGACRCRNLSVMKLGSEELDEKQRLCLVHGLGVSRDVALSMPASSFTLSYLLDIKCTQVHIAAAGLGCQYLASRGAKSAADLIPLGYGALNLVDDRFLEDAVATFGAEDVTSSFVKGACDAVAIAGSDACRALNTGVAELLGLCAGCPCEAEGVLRQLDSRVALRGVPCSTLLDTGLRAKKLILLGYCNVSILEQTKATPSELKKLGFEPILRAAAQKKR